MRSPLWLLLAAALSACGGPTPTPPVSVAALTLGNDGTYEARTVTLETILDLVALKGLAAELRGGARIEINDSDPQLQNVGEITNEKLREILVKNQGLPPRASFIQKDGVFYPADFHTWNMTTLYYNYEVAYSYFAAVGQVPPEELQGSLVFYFPEFFLTTSSANPTPLKDNALWFPPIQGFAILPFEKFQSLPLAMNQGVIAHEYAHRVFNVRVYRGQALPEPLTKWQGFTGAGGINLLKGLDEGFADYHAFLASCRTEFGCTTRSFEASIGAEETDKRDIAKPNKCMDKTLRDFTINLSAAEFSARGLEYQFGTVFASALYEAGRKRNAHQQYARALVAAYDDSTPGTPGLQQLITAAINEPGKFTLAQAAGAVLMHVPDASGLRTELCNQFLDHLQIPRGELDAFDPQACPPASTQDISCPNIN